MKKSIMIIASLLFLMLSLTSVMAEEETTAVYGETYMCGTAYTVRIVSQPQMMAQIAEKINYNVRRLDSQTQRYKPFQINARFGQQTEEDILLNFRIQIRNLNSKALSGLSSDSFILTGKVRDRIIEYTPEIMVPFVISEDDWLRFVRKINEPVYYLNHIVPDIVTFDWNKFMNPHLMEGKYIDSMRVQDIRLIYRVPSWLASWDLHIRPQAFSQNSGLKTCDLVLHIPTIINEITRETYKYPN